MTGQARTMAGINELPFPALEQILSRFRSFSRAGEGLHEQARAELEAARELLAATEAIKGNGRASVPKIPLSMWRRMLDAIAACMDWRKRNERPS